MSGRLFLVDGDNHIYEGLKGIESVGLVDSVLVYVSQRELKEKLESEFGDRIKVKEVTPGDQAVDNVIKSRIGSEIKQDRYREVIVVSHDKGYKEMIDKAHKNGKMRYRQAKSIKEVLRDSFFDLRELTFEETLNETFRSR